MNANENLKLNREQLCINVAQMLYNHIQEAERLIPRASEGAKLFHEHNFSRHEWNVYSANGYPSTMPLFYFQFERVDYVEKGVSEADIAKFMRLIMD